MERKIFLTNPSVQLYSMIIKDPGWKVLRACIIVLNIVILLHVFITTQSVVTDL